MPDDESMALNLQILSTTSAADERMKFWTTKNPWRRFFRFGRSMVKDIEHATKEINHVAGELSVRISPLPSHALGELRSHSYSNRFMLAKSRKSADLSLKNLLVLQIVLPAQTPPSGPFTALDPVIPLHPVPGLDLVPPPWAPQSLPIVLCTKAGRRFVGHGLGH